MNGVRIFSHRKVGKFILKQGHLTSKMIGSSHVKVLMYILYDAETKAYLICSSTNYVKRANGVSRMSREHVFMNIINKALPE